jgi:hypothetical protein
MRRIGIIRVESGNKLTQIGKEKKCPDARKSAPGHFKEEVNR